jgi:cytochrome c oxidase subunit II
MVAHSALSPAGTDAELVARLWWAFVAIAVVVYVGVMAALVHAMRRARSGRNPALADPAGHDRRARHLVFAAAAGTLLVLLAMLAGDFVIGRLVLGETSPPGDPVHIRITAHQFWWEIDYDPDDPARSIKTANELTVPVNRPVELTLRSQDVIHSFWLPALAGKKDLIPGTVNVLRFSATKPGRYEGQCAEFCGYQHANMRTALTAVSDGDFDAWRAHEQGGARQPATDDERRGHDIFMKSSCVICHSIRGTSASASNGPDLTHFAERPHIAASPYPNDPAWLAAWISAPQQLKPGTTMPATQLPPNELAALVTFLRSLK